MNLTVKEKDAVREMMQTEGWRLLVASLKEREHALMEALVLSGNGTFALEQAKILALREVMRKPKTLLEGGPDDESGREEAR
jgi:hypothetical protein